MCQLLGMNAAKPADLRFSFTGFAARGGLTDHHDDGFGIGFFEDKACRLFMDNQAAATSPVAELIKRYPIKSCNVVSHIRKATQGDPLRLENSHPFTRELWGRHWLFAHNGDLINYHPVPGGNYQPVGNTDSERAFCALLEELKQISPREPCSTGVVFEALCAMSERTAEFGVFNFLLSNGQALFAHCSTRLYTLERKWPFSKAKLVDSELGIDFAQTNDPEDHLCFVATQPLTIEENWQQLQPGQLLWIEGGRIMRKAQLKIRESVRQKNEARLTVST